MERIGVFGLSWKQGGTESLARFTIPPDQRPELIVRLSHELGVNELVYLATCNRVEVMLVGDGVTPMTEYRDRLYEALTNERATDGNAKKELKAWAGEGAVEHFFMVVSGLDSAEPGETEILGQVKAAFKTASKAGLVGVRLNKLHQEAVRVARRIRSSTAVGSGKVSLANLAIDHIKGRLREVPGAVALLGVTDMTRAAATELAKEGVATVIVNRTIERADELARDVGGKACSLDDFKRAPPTVEAVLLATGSKDPVLVPKDLSRLAANSVDGKPLIVDMSVPPNVLQEDADAAGLVCISMGQIIDEASENRDARLVEMADARICVDQALDDLRDWMAERNVAPLVVELRDRYRRDAREQVNKLLDRKLAHLKEDERGEIREWADSLARRLAHIPLVGIRNLAVKKGQDSVEAFFGAADELLHDELGKVADRVGRPPEVEEGC